ncbi:MAG: 3-hydroxyacyl-CoA dehydrogenase family protein [bacterium]
MKVARIGFYGIRNIGPGLVQSTVNKGLTAVVFENNSDVYHNALSIIERNIDYEIDHWGLTPKDKKVMMSRIEHIEKFQDFSKFDIDLIIESVEENLQKKQETAKKIYDELGMNIPVVLTAQTNTIEAIIDGLDDKERTVNIHPVPSVPIYKIVELIKSGKTTESTLEIVKYFFEKLDIKCVEVEDTAGMVGPRILVSTVLEACDMMRDSHIRTEEFDLIMKKGLKMYKGPLSMADEIGLDNMKLWIEELSKVNSSVYKVPQIILDLIGKGHTGVKAGKGFLNYK